jgi:hypothetical protein
MLMVQAISVAAFLILMRERGGLQAHVESWGDGRSAAFAGSLVFVLLPFINIGAYALLVYLAYRPNSVHSPLVWFCALISLAPIFLATGSRSGVVYPVIVGLMILMLRRRSISVVKPLVAFGFILIVLAILGEFRRSSWRASGPDWRILYDLKLPESDSRQLTAELVERTGSIRGSLPILAKVPQRVDYLKGESYLAVLTLPIPRFLWPDKPRQIGGMVGSEFFGIAAGVPPGAVGEAYWNFGFFGIPAVYFLMGCFHRWVVQFFLRHQEVPAMVALYGVIIFSFSVPDTPAFVNLVYGVFSLVLVLVLFGILRRRAAPKPWIVAPCSATTR